MFRPVAARVSCNEQTKPPRTALAITPHSAIGCELYNHWRQTQRWRRMCTSVQLRISRCICRRGGSWRGHHHIITLHQGPAADENVTIISAMLAESRGVAVTVPHPSPPFHCTKPSSHRLKGEVGTIAAHSRAVQYCNKNNQPETA